jgi:hypothetical protein
VQSAVAHKLQVSVLFSVSFSTLLAIQLENLYDRARCYFFSMPPEVQVLEVYNYLLVPPLPQLHRGRCSVYHNTTLRTHIP